MKLLIVDDEVDLCILSKGYFLKKGYEVLLAYDRATGIEMLEKEHPDLLFLDNNLSDGLGWPLLPEILKKYPALKVFLISAYHPQVPSIPEKAYVKLLEKPISFARLNGLLRDLATS